MTADPTDEGRGPLDDIDIIAKVKDTSVWDDDPETAMRAAGDLVRPAFATAAGVTGNHGARVCLKDPPIEGEHLDIVVARATSNGTVLESASGSRSRRGPE